MRGISAERMREIDRIAQEEIGIPSIVLMENAGRSVSEIALDTIKGARRTRLYIFCGRGNNGGDGMVCARYLLNSNIRPSIFLLSEPSDLKQDPRINFKILSRMNLSINPITGSRDIRRLKNRFDCDCIVDAIFGTGFSGEVTGLAQDLIDLINRRNRTTISVDVPSGLNATTGIVENLCVRATKTVTFGLPKKGFFINDGPEYAGEVIVKDIGLPRSLL